MLLNDKVSFRMQWPQYADLQVNGMVADVRRFKWSNIVVVKEKIMPSV